MEDRGGLRRLVSGKSSSSVPSPVFDLLNPEHLPDGIDSLNETPFRLCVRERAVRFSRETPSSRPLTLERNGLKGIPFSVFSPLWAPHVTPLD